jgi:hypothetical protein
MKRPNRAVLALIAVLALAAAAPLVAVAMQQAAQEPPKAVWVTPFRGVADVEYLKPVPKVDHKEGVVTTNIQVRNKANGALIRLTVEEFWYDRSGTLITGSKDICKRPLKAGETYTFTLKSAYDKRSYSNSYKFSHANGDVKPKLVKAFE